MSRQEVLVDADWLEEHASDDHIVVVEVDEDTTAYDGGHIEGAIKLDWKKDLQDPVRRDFVNREQFGALLSERGVSNDDTVVLYGGRKKWELDARPLSSETVTRPATQYEAAEPDLSIRAFRDEVISAIGTDAL